MHVAVVGAGPVGTMVALHLSAVGKHNVVLVARPGKRLDQLVGQQQAQQTQLRTSANAPTPLSGAVDVAPELDKEVAFDWVIVAVTNANVDALLPTLSASRAKRVCFMFNTVRPLQELEQAVGARRFAFAFPAVMAKLEPDGALFRDFPPASAQVTVTSDAELQRMLLGAGIPHVTLEREMQAWLRWHGAFVVPLTMLAHAANGKRGAGYGASLGAARVFKEGVRIMRAIGEPAHPAFLGILSRLPAPVVAAVFMGLSRMPAIRDGSNYFNAAEMREIRDAVVGLAEGKSVHLALLPTALNGE